MRQKDYPITCDISGLRVPRSKAKRTWDGLLVHPLFWSPKHPQLDIRPVLERPVPGEVRPPQDKFVVPDYGYGTICLKSPGGKTFVVYADTGGTLKVAEGSWGNQLNYFAFGGWKVVVNDSGVLSVSSTTESMAQRWYMYTVNGDCYELTVSGGSLQLVSA